VVINSKSTAERQLELMRQAAVLINDGIYIRAVPLLEEAAGYNARYTPAAEEELKKAYLALIDTRGFRRKYTDILERQMSRKDAHSGYFAEAANFYLGISRIPEALAVLKRGIEATGDEILISLYESCRYAFSMNRTSYDQVSAIYGTTVQVQSDGLWGIATSDGLLIIPCEYERISTYSVDRAIVMANGEVYAIDKNCNRVARLHERASDFGNFADDRIPLLIGGTWYRAMGDLAPGTQAFEQIGMYSGGYAAACVDGKWGVINTTSGWLIPAEYDGIIMDELGRCYAQGSVFVQSGGEVFLFTGNRQTGGPYEDARPFSGEGYAAVKRNGLWGFIDTSGTIMIDFVFEDALSFGQHLAAIKQDGFWGYISLYGNIAIEPVFIEAKSFCNGSAPVLTERGWLFITLLEYMRRQGL